MKKLFSFILLCAAMMMSGSAWADAPEPLTFTNTDEEACILFIVDYAAGVNVLPNLEYKVNDGNWTTVSTWIPYQSIISISPIQMPANGQVQLRGNNERGLALFASSLSPSAVPLCQFKFMGGTLQNLTTTDVSIEVSGNIMSLISSTEEVAIPDGDTSFELTIIHPQAGELKVDAYPRGFYEMFMGCTNITDASKLQLPAEELENECYYSMFDGCTNLTEAPTISAATLAPNSCYYMFQGCTSLTKAPELPATTAAYRCYRQMFKGCTSLTNAPALPATELAEECYLSMFDGCSSLETAPELPATTLAPNCYQTMFKNCTTLTTVPDILPATTMASSCYKEMFEGCASLKTAPKLPATTLAFGCYHTMFSGCSELTKAPELPASVLTESCYNSMFNGCGSLVTAPVLPATTLAKLCYNSMFKGCTSLNYIKCLAPKIEKIESYYPTNNWLQGANPSGTRTFVKAAGATGWTNDVSGIPSGWTQETVSILDDSKGYVYSEFEGKSSLEMNRTFKHNGTNHTICLPFDLDEDAFASSLLGAGCTKLQTLGSAAIVDGTLEVTMVDVNPKAIEAGKPYLIAWENDGEDVVCPTFDDVTFKEVSGGSIGEGDVTFHGLLGPQSVEVNDSSVLFVGTTGNLNWPNAGSQINGYRCYFKVKTTNSPIRRGMNAVLAEGRTTPTGMNQVTGDRLQVTGVEKLIEAGKVVIISDGVRYNLNGQIIK